MRAIILLFVALAYLAPPSSAAAKPTSSDLVGKWEGAMEFGKFKFKMVLRIAKTDEGRLAVTMDVPEQGAKGLPVSAILFNSPDVRIEIDQFQTAYNGKLSDDLNKMTGEFEEGPGGRPMPVTFVRSTKPDEAEPEKIYTFKPGESLDIRGHWKTSIEAMPGMNLTIAWNIGRIPDGTYRAHMDVLEQGAREIPASSLTTSNKQVELKWDALQITFNGKLSDDANRLEGEWKQRGNPIVTTFTRLDAPATLAPKNVSYDPDPNTPNDVRGQWAGRLDLPGQKIRLIIKVGKAPDGAFAGTLASPDQGGAELPMTKGSFTPPQLVLEWQGIRGKFEGTLTNNGSVLEGTWEQMGNKMPLKLERAATNKK
jgi:hypothetical protein